MMCFMQRILLAAAACMWLATVVLAPATRGVGAALSGHELADLIGSKSLGGRVPAIVGPLWYLMPLSATVVLATLGLGGAAAGAVRIAAALLASVVALGFTAMLARWATVGPGSWCAIAGAALAFLAVAIEIGIRSRRTRSVL